MKGLIPIIIAMVLVLSIVLSSLYFITTMNIRSSITNVSYSTVYWLKIGDELDNLAYIALKYGSRAADAEFEREYNNQIQGVSTINELRTIVKSATNKANQVMEEKVSAIINNWIKLKENEGIIVKIKGLSSAYVVDFGRGYSNVYFDLVIITPTGESREFSRNYTVFYSIKLEKTNIDPINNLIEYVKNLKVDLEFKLLGITIFKVTLDLSFLAPDVNLTLIFDVEAYLDFNGNKYYYVLDREGSMAIINNFVNVLSILNRSISSAEYTPAGVYYYGNGCTKVAYRIKYSNLTTLETIVGILSSLFRQQYLGVTSSIDIDGFKARSAILITT